MPSHLFPGSWWPHRRDPSRSRTSKRSKSRPESSDHSEDERQSFDESEPKNRSGLHSLWPKDRDAQKKTRLDIVAVHGLSGDLFNTWKAKDTHKIWLRDFLHETFQDAHIMTYGYNSKLVTDSVAGIYEFAVGLLAALDSRRSRLGTKGSPVLFVCHSLGGIVVKQALIAALERPDSYGELNSMVGGIMFFGTPHSGSDVAGWPGLLRDLARASMLGRFRSDILKDLSTGATSLDNITRQFVLRAQDLKFVTFYESERIGLGVIVKGKSAIMYHANEQAIPIEANHIDMCKFSTIEDTSFEIVLDNLSKLAEHCRKLAPTPSHGPESNVRQRIISDSRNGKDSINNRAQSVEPSRSPALNLAPGPVPVIGNEHWLVRRQPSTLFEGQNQVLEMLAMALLPRDGNTAPNSRLFVLEGLDGSGKGEIALQFAERNRNHYWGVFWADVTNDYFAHVSFGRIARHFGSSLGADVSAVKAVTTMLSKAHDPWLLVLENPEDANTDYSQYMPSSLHGSILILKRSDAPTTFPYVNARTVISGMGHSSASKLLLKLTERLGYDTDRVEASEAIVRSVGDFPLALVVVGGLIRSGLCRMEAYPDLQRRTQAEGETSRLVRMIPYYAAYFAAFELCMNHLTASGSMSAMNAIQLFQVLAFFDRRHISEDIFRRAWHAIEHLEYDGDLNHQDIDRLGRWHVEQARALPSGWSSSRDPSGFRDACTLLHSLGLIAWDALNRVITIDAAIHFWANGRPNDLQLAKAWAAASSIIALSIRNDDYYWQQPHWVEPAHLLEVIERRPAGFERLFPLNNLDIARTLYRFYWQLLRTQECRQVHNFMWLEMERRMGLTESSMGANSNSLALYHLRIVMLEKQGSHEEAIRLGENVLRHKKAHCRLDFDDVMLSQHALAVSHLSAGRSQQAILLLEALHPFIRATDGPTITNASPHNASITDNPQELIEGLRKDATGIVETGVYRLNAVLWLTYDLGRACIVAGLYDRGIMWLEKALEHDDAQLPAGHYHKITRRLTLAVAYLAVGFDDKATAVFDEMVNMNERTPTPHTELVTLPLVGLSQLLFLRRRFKRAIPVLNEVLGLSPHERGCVLPPETARTLRCQLHHCYLLTGQAQAANEMPGDQDYSDMDTVLRASKRGMQRLLTEFTLDHHLS